MKYCLLLLLLAVSDVFAGYYYEIREIETKQEGQNPLAAKQTALVKSARRAFDKLVSAEFNESTIDGVSDKQIQDCIYDYSIENEKYSDSFYIAKFSYRFSKKKVLALLKIYGIDSGAEETVLPNEIKIVIYTKDFIRYYEDLKELKIQVERFSGESTFIKIERNNIKKIRELRIKYAQL